ncbi:hypothetical protein V6C42_17665 [Pseudoclostridium thermosuccinogenes]|uniref:hypothetical protein n=1 Tax=Clostridium thermosuccinogenes TaxID=84032 RepID=UPI002FDAC361
MRNLKRFLAVLVVVAVMATSMIPAFAADAELSPIEVVTGLGIVEGAGNGVDDEYLAADTTKIQAAVILLKALGLYEEAIDFDGEENFADADEVTWAAGRRILAYLKAHPELGWVGNPDGTFDAYAVIEPAQLYKVMLELLGYEQNVDFKWSEVLEKAVEFGMAGEYVDGEGVTNEDMIGIIYEALYTPVKGGTEEDVLLVYLAEINEAIKEKAIELGLIVEEEPEELAILDAKAVGASKVQVTFNKAADDQTIVLKRGNVTVSVKATTWNDNKTVATLETTTKLLEADYTVKVGDLTKGFSVKAEKLDKIELDSAYAKQTALGSNTATVGYTAYNQYGEDITEDIKAGNINWTAVPNASAVGDNKGTVTITNTVYSTMPWTVGTSQIVLTGVDTTTGVTVSGTLTIAEPAKLAKLDLTEIINKAGDDKILNQNDTGSKYDWRISYTAVDQYGGTLNSFNYFDNNVIVNSAPAGVVTLANDGGTAYFKITPPGNTYDQVVTVTVIDKTSGANDSFTFTIEKPVAVDSFQVNQPDDIIVAGETIEIPYVAYDQYGNEITAYDDLTGVTFSDTALRWKEDPITGKGILQYTPASNVEGNKTYIITYSNVKAPIIVSFNVLKMAEPTVIDSISKDAILKLTNGATSTLDSGDFIVKDQYDREISLRTADNTDYRIVIAEVDTSDTDVSLSNGPIFKDSGAYTLTGTANAGDKAFKAILYKGTAGNDVVEGSELEFKATTVAKSSIVSYKVNDIEKVLATSTPGLNINNPDDYKVAVEVYGELADGSKVALNSNDVTINTVGNIGYDVSGKVYGTRLDTAGTDEIATLLINIRAAKGNVTLTETLTVTDAAPVATAIAVEKVSLGSNEAFENNVLAVDGNTLTANLVTGGRVKFVVTDQYGVKTQLAPAFYYLNEDDVATAGTYSINNTTGSLTIVSANVADGDELTITAVTKNGLNASVKVIVKK